MDQIDSRILSSLQRDARTSMAELAQNVGLSTSACHRRVKLLEEAGLIAGYQAKLDREALGLHLELFVTVSLTSQASEALAAFEAAVQRVPEILECHLLAGRADYLMRLAVADMAQYEVLHRTRLTRLPGVANMETSFNLRTVTPFTGYTLPMARF
jgi:DNA-binding Lrp family transcriptional regulator